MNATKILCPLNEAAEKFPNQPAIIFGTRAITYTQFDAYVSSTVKYLKKIGVQPQDKVAIVSPNSVEYVIVLLALWRMGAVGCLLSTRLPAQNLCEQISNLNARFLLSSSHKILFTAEINLKKISLEETINFDVRDFSLSGPAEIDLNQEATLMFTSGTSHEPKAALHTYGNHYFNAFGSNENISLSSGDRWLLSLPLYHVGGLGIFFRNILSGAAVVIPNQEEDLPTAIGKYKITHVSLVTTQLYRILQNKDSLEDLSTLKVALVGGSGIPHSLLKEAIQLNLPIYLTYGLTEMASQVATTRMSFPNAFPSCRGLSLVVVGNPGQVIIGPPIPTILSGFRPSETSVGTKTFGGDNFGIKILNHRELKISEEGEIWVRGKTLFKGYFKNGKISLPLTEDGWFKTGDLGRMDADGNLIVTGRKDNMFISSGENIQPEEIEGYLQDLEEVEKAIVVGIENEEFGFRPIAFVKIREGAELSKDVLVKHLEKNLARFKIPIAFYEWPPEFSADFSKENRRKFIQLLKEKEGGLKRIS